MITREIQINTILGEKGSAFLFGARGTGKTLLALDWLSKQPKRLSFDLLDGNTYRRYLDDPGQLKADIEGAIHSNQEVLSVLVDEIQRIPELLDVVHQLCTLHEGKVRFLLTGSSARKLRRGGANLLAGRLYTFSLFPFTSGENPRPLTDLLLTGNLPAAVGGERDTREVLRAYVATYLYEEIRLESAVRRIEVFSRFLDLAAQYHGKILNYARMGRPLGLTGKTVAAYFSILEDTLLGFHLPGYETSLRRQLRLAPKFFFIDNGLASALRGELLLELRESTSRFGELFECLVIQELMRANTYSRLDLRLSYWQTSTGHEIDVVVSRAAGPPLAVIEIKSAVKPQEDAWRGFRAFAQEFPLVPRYCLCRTPLVYTVDVVKVLPWEQGPALLRTLFRDNH